MSKKEKIKLLKGLQSNKISIKDLSPPEFLITVYSSEMVKYYINGKEVSEELYKEINERETLLRGPGKIVAGFDNEPD